MQALTRIASGLYIPKAQRRFSDEQGCVEPTEEMRANHMKYILHQRDATVHEGIRTEQYSLQRMYQLSCQRCCRCTTRRQRQTLLQQLPYLCSSQY